MKYITSLLLTLFLSNALFSEDETCAIMIGDEIDPEEFSEILGKKIYFCLEANPKLYGCEYINSTMEAISLIRKINKPYFKLNLDLGTIIENKENISEIISRNFNLIKHVQISTPYLRGISRYKSKIKKLIYYLYKFKYKGHVSIEMIEKKKNNIKIVSQSISIVKLMFK